ncbi:hypothetical protein D3C74_440430 [compost metagenome]
MGLAIHTQQAPVGIGHAQRVEVGVAGLFEPAQRQYHAQLAGQCGEAREHLAVAIFLGQSHVFMALFDAEVRRGEQLLQQDHLRALLRCVTDELLGAIKVAG